MSSAVLYHSVDGIYDAKELSLPWADALGEGVLFGGVPAGLDPLKVGPISPASMGVQIEAGAAWVKNDRTTDTEAYYEGGLWRVSRPASFQLPIVAADPTQPRVDRIILEVLDKQFGAASDLARVRAVAGTPAATPAAPAEPRSALTLATVAVAAAATSIAAGNVTDARPRASSNNGRGAPTVGFEGIRTLGTNRADGTVAIFAPAEVQFIFGWAYSTASPQPSSGGYVCQVPGTYFVMAQAAWASVAGGARLCQIRKNGSLANISAQLWNAGATRNIYYGCSGILRLVAGDWLDMQIRQDSGGSVLEAADGHIKLQAWRIGA